MVKWHLSEVSQSKICKWRTYSSQNRIGDSARFWYCDIMNKSESRARAAQSFFLRLLQLIFYSDWLHASIRLGCWYFILACTWWLLKMDMPLKRICSSSLGLMLKIDLKSLGVWCFIHVECVDLMDIWLLSFVWIGGQSPSWGTLLTLLPFISISCDPVPWIMDTGAHWEIAKAGWKFCTCDCFAFWNLVVQIRHVLNCLCQQGRV